MLLFANQVGLWKQGESNATKQLSLVNARYSVAIARIKQMEQNQNEEMEKMKAKICAKMKQLYTFDKKFEVCTNALQLHVENLAGAAKENEALVEKLSAVVEKLGNDCSTANANFDIFEHELSEKKSKIELLKNMMQEIDAKTRMEWCFFSCTCRRNGSFAA